ncbi:class I adenylate-forming enzyme family protein [Phaeobacter sp. HF9A]|uniref:class I adenylate-forming enzyme family protein n=1 Tax=Phaeobacter sp. HF9A TaxID=2721561 RepID=UPI001430237C|nr:class I adenylate-forming enzyme family protein [Phaeobacter sp. HF9A]NIZ12599.1 acyl--CoA ligase [Phaeobacter sp. HF9A]
MYAQGTLLTHFLAEAAQNRPHAPAIADATRRFDYRSLAAAAARIADALEDLGVRRGDRVILSMPNSVAFASSFWGILAAGAVAVPVNPSTKARKFAYILDNCAPRAVLADGDTAEEICTAMADLAEQIPLLTTATQSAPGPLDALLDRGEAQPLRRPDVIDQDLAVIIYTSGSTGDPKGVMLSHLNMTSAARSVASYLGYRAEDRIFVAVPMSFDYGLHQLTMAALTGAAVEAEPSFGQPFFTLKRLQDTEATVFPIVPSMVPIIAPLADRFDLGAIRLVSSTAAALHPSVIDRLQAMLPKATVFSMYGLTECHRCTYLPPEELEGRKMSVGIAIPNTEMWVVDEAGTAHHRNATGELVIRGATVMKGYWKNPTATAKRLKPGPLAGEWVLYTGDTCRIDADGFLYFVGRSDDILKIGGEKVAPIEVETTLIAHPEVTAACVLGEADPVHGQICVAHVETGTSVQALLTWCRDRLDPQAVPAKIKTYTSLARTQNGKIDRAVLASGQAATLQPAT